MSTDYRVVLIDDFDWTYVGYSKDNLLSDVRSLGWDVEASLVGMVVCTTRWHPEEDCRRLLQGGKYGAAYFQEVCSETLQEIHLRRRL